jgi:hypothetical protein
MPFPWRRSRRPDRVATDPWRDLIPDMRPWGRRPLTIPPNSAQAWIHLAAWEIWMGVLISIVAGVGVALIATSPDRIFTISDLNRCYGPPPVPIPCEQVVYRGGAMNAAFSALCGSLLIGVALWLLWELWSAVEPKPITDDFLRLLRDSFARNWRNPLTWPWPRLLWAYGFALVGASVTAAVAITIWTTVASAQSARPPTVRVDTSQSFRIGGS